MSDMTKATVCCQVLLIFGHRANFCERDLWECIADEPLPSENPSFLNTDGNMGNILDLVCLDCHLTNNMREYLNLLTTHSGFGQWIGDEKNLYQNIFPLFKGTSGGNGTLRFWNVWKIIRHSRNYHESWMFEYELATKCQAWNMQFSSIP